MNESWLTTASDFSVLTKIVRGSIRGGVVKLSSLSDEEEEIADRGVAEGVFAKDESKACPRCTKKYEPGSVPPSCEDCQADLERLGTNDIDPTYREQIWPEELKEILSRYIDSFSIEFSKNRDIEDVPLSDIGTSDSETILHISPYFDFENDFVIFPGYDDVFLAWSAIPAFVNNPDEMEARIQDFLLTHEFNPTDLGSGSVQNVFYTGPGSPGPEYSAKQSWYTLLDNIEKTEAHDRSKARFGINYNEMFERLGVEFLHTLFPHAYTIHLGGDYVPDGVIQFQEENRVLTYLVESKCYSDGFKVFDEIDKGNRYIRRFVRNLEGVPDANFDLRGYIFLAHEFKEDRLSDDIAQFLSESVDVRNLDVVCVNSGMMKNGMGRLSYLYRRQPSATYRVYAMSDYYRKIIEQLVDFTDNHGTNEDKFRSNIIKTLEGMGHKTSPLEERIRGGLEPSKTWEELEQISQENLPEDYSAEI